MMLHPFLYHEETKKVKSGGDTCFGRGADDLT